MVHLGIGEVAVQAWWLEPNPLAHMWRKTTNTPNNKNNNDNKQKTKTKPPKTENHHHHNEIFYIYISFGGGWVEGRQKTGGSKGSLVCQPV